MRGTILGQHDGRGVLLSADDRRLEFPIAEWRSAGAPVAGQIVDFVEENGQARAVFAVPGGAQAGPAPVPTNSGAFVLGASSVGCLLLGFIIPLLPTIAAFILGVLGAGQAIQERNDTALILSRIGWIGALVLLVTGVIAVLAILFLFGNVILAALATAWVGLGPID